MSAERVLVNVPAPMLRCSAPVLVLVHMCFYIHAVGSVLLDGARVPQPYAPTIRCSTPLHSCQLLKSCTPMLRSSLESAPLHSAAALPLRCSAPLRCAALRSDAPLRSAALVLTFCAPMLRCWDAIAQLTCSAQRRSSAPAQVQPITTAQRRSSAAAHRRNCNQTTAQRRSSAAAHWRKRSLTTAQRRSSAQVQGNNSAAAQRNLTTAQRRSSRESIARTYRLERRSGAAAQSSLRTHIAPTLLLFCWWCAMICSSHG